MSSSPSSSSRQTGARRSGASTSGGFEGPSPSRRRGVANEVWPEPFLESLATQVAGEASRTAGRLSAAPALANLFQVCSTWRAINRSDLLWHRLASRIWGRDHLLRDTWYDEYVYWHRTASNFRTRTSSHTVLQFNQSEVDDPIGLTCRCLTLSGTHLACGFADGTVRLFHLTTRLHVSTFRPHHREDRLGQFSRTVSGIALTESKVVFATLDGDIHVAIIDGGGHTRRARLGEVLNDGVLVDFAGRGRWWVGLCAGVPGRAFHIWDEDTEERVYVGGSLTDPEAVPGWHMLTELTELLGRVRVTSQESAVACTSVGVMVIDLLNHGLVLGEEEYRRGVIVTAVDVSNESYVVVDRRGVARVRRVGIMEEVCSFTVRGASQQGLVGCINTGYALMCAGGVIRVWDTEHGEYLYRFRERIGDANAIVADERYVAASCADTSLHLWDFSPQQL